MKKILTLISFCALLFACTDKNNGEQEARLNNLAAECAKLNTTITSLQKIVESVNDNQALSVFTPVTDENGKVSGYLFTFEGEEPVAVYNTPAYTTLGMKDGNYCWMVNNESVCALNNAPKFKVDNEGMKMSLDGTTWTAVGEVSNPMFASVSESANAVTVTFEGGFSLVLPKADKMQVELFSDKKAFTPNDAAYIQYKISGTGDKAVYVETYATDGWVAEVFKESATEGVIKVVAPEDVTKSAVKLFVTTEAGDVFVADIDLATTSPAPDSPVLATLADAVSIGCAGGDIEVKVSTNMEYVITTDSDWVVVKSTKAVREDAIAFEVLANKSEDARSSVIKFQSGNYFTICTVLQEADYGEVDNEPQTPVDSDLSKNGTANCYIVNVEGAYSFDASVIGNGAAGIIEGARFHVEAEEVALFPESVELLWCQNECVKDVTLDKAAKRISFNATGSKGNALIAVYDEYGDIAWSWHIWCTNMPKEVTHSNMYGTQFTLQDRNIGAVSVNPNEVEKTHGLFYQWGRKDPFIPSKDLAATMINDPSNDIWGAITMPTVPFKKKNNTYEWYNGVQAKIEHGLWGNPDYTATQNITGNIKTVYDPCPVGYVVPTQDTWAGLTAGDLQFISQGFFQLLEGGKKVFYPYAGSVDQGNDDGKDCGYTGYYQYKQEGTRDRYYFCRLWMSATGTYAAKPVGGQQLQVWYDPKDEKISVTGYVGDMRHRLVPVRCMKIK